MKRALITGITGQDGAYLAEFLLNKGYQVHGLKRRASLLNTARIDHLYHDGHEAGLNFNLHYADMTDTANLTRLISDIQPDEVYNLAAQSQVGVSFEMPEYTANVNAMGALKLLEAIRASGLAQRTRFFQASTAQLYGEAQVSAHNELTYFAPRSPYAASKLYAHWAVVNYREAYNMYACNGIMFNHESPLRGETFVTRKITMAATRIALGLQNCLYLGNLNAQRDWGHAKDYVRAMWLMLQQPQPDDYVVATGVTTSVRDFARLCFAELGIEIEFSGKGKFEKGVVIDIDAEKMEALELDPDVLRFGQTLIKIDPQYYRPADVTSLCGDAAKATECLGWKPNFNLDELVTEMITADLHLVKIRNILPNLRH